MFCKLVGLCIYLENKLNDSEKIKSQLIADLKHKIYPELPVFLMTGFGGSMTEKSQQRYGIKYILSKPIVIKELSESVSKGLSHLKE